MWFQNVVKRSIGLVLKIPTFATCSGGFVGKSKHNHLTQKVDIQNLYGI